MTSPASPAPSGAVDRGGGALDALRNFIAPVGRSASAATVRDTAVVDVGSNSVRLVIYRVEGRAIVSIFNDRAAAGLGAQLARTGRLAPEGVEAARAAFARFRMCLDARGVREVMPVATAAVREAKDGDVFAADAEAILGAPLRVLSGADEGRVAALGVLAAEPEADGLVGDLGGSSLEFARVGGGQARAGVTLKLGPFAAPDGALADPMSARRMIDKALAEAPDDPATTLYAVGGAWRNFAKVDIHRSGHPLKILHGYTMDRSHALKAARWAATCAPDAFEDHPDVSRRRADTLPWAAAVLERTLKRFSNIERVVISAYGLREGTVFDAMPPHERMGDPLLAGLESATRAAGGTPAFWEALERWLGPVGELLPGAFGADRDRVLRAAVARCVDIGGRLHPDHREDLAFDTVAVAPVVGISHPERAFIAAAVHHRYAGRTPPKDRWGVCGLLSEEQREAALALGLVTRLGCDLSGRTADLLERSQLSADDTTLTLTVRAAGASLATDRADKRLAQAAAALGVSPQIVVA